MIVTSRIQIGVHYQYSIYTLENSKQKQICKIVRTFLKYDLVYLDSVNIQTDIFVVDPKLKWMRLICVSERNSYFSIY